MGFIFLCLIVKVCAVLYCYTAKTAFMVSRQLSMEKVWKQVWEQVY